MRRLDRGSCRRRQLRLDQNGLGLPERENGQVQPASRDRRGAAGNRSLCRAGGSPAKRRPPAPPKTPRPIAAFFVSLAGSALVLTMLVLSDGRVLELKKAREDARQLDLEIARLREQNRELRAAVDAARRHEFPAEKVPREELHLAPPADLCPSYPDPTLSGK